MSFNVNEFRSQLVNDGARPNLFEMEMNFPDFADANASRPLSFLVKTAAIPASTIGTVELQYFGRTLKFAGNRTFADLSITVLNDENFLVRTAFQKWLSGLNSHVGNKRLPTADGPLGYTKDATVIQFGKKGNVLKKYKFIGCYPTELSEIALDWSSNDTIEEYTVTLSYQWWEADDGSTDQNVASIAGE